MFAGNRKQAASVSLIGPAFFPKLWLEAEVSPPVVLWVQGRLTVGNSSALPLCQVFQLDLIGDWDEPNELGYQSKTKAGQEQREISRSHMEE